MLPEERNYYRSELLPPEDLVAITMLVIRTSIFLEIDTSTSEEILQCVKNVFVFLDEFDVEFWLYYNSANDFLFRVWISHVNSEAAFTVHEPDHIFGIKILL